MAKITSIAELRKLIQIKEKQLGKLQSQRGKAAKDLAAIDRKIAELTSEAPAKKTRKKRKKRKAVAKPKRKVAKRKAAPKPKKVKKVTRAKKVTKAKKAKKAKRAKKAAPKRRRAPGTSLADNIARVLKQAGKGMRAKEIADAVLKGGYKTVSKDFTAVVAVTLATNKRFKRVDRGVYQAV